MNMPIRAVDPATSKLERTRKPLFESASELMANPPHAKFYFRPLSIETDSIVQVYGDSGSGKSFLVIQMAFALATGSDWFGTPIDQASVLYCAGEGYRGAIRRLAGQEIESGAGLVGKPLWVASRPVPLLDAESVYQLLAELMELSEDQRPKVVIIDTLARSFVGGDENSAKDMGLFVAALDEIRERLSCTVIVVHHSGKAVKSAPRGSSVMRAAVDVEMRVSKGATGLVEVICTKSKDSEPFAPCSFRLRSIELPEKWNDEDGNTMTTAVLDAASESLPTSPAGPPAHGKWQRRAMAALREMTEMQSANLAKSGRDAGQVRVLIDDWMKALEDSGCASRQARWGVKTGLHNKGLVRLDEPFVYLGTAYE